MAEASERAAAPSRGPGTQMGFLVFLSTLVTALLVAGVAVQSSYRDAQRDLNRRVDDLERAVDELRETMQKLKRAIDRRI